MDESSDLWSITAYVFLLSSMAVGSGMLALTPELHRFAVESHGWMTSSEFAQLYTIGQTAPGPNFLFITLVGLKVAGWKGALGVTVALAIPSLVSTLAVLRFAGRVGSPRLRLAFRIGLAQASVGLMAATTWILLDAAGHDWRGWLLAAAGAAFVLLTRLNPLIMVAAGAAIGLAGLL